MALKPEDKLDCAELNTMNLKTAVELTKIPFALSLSKGGRNFGMLTKWVSVWKPFMLRQAQHERLPHASTAVFRLIDSVPRYAHIASQAIGKTR